MNECLNLANLMMTNANIYAATYAKNRLDLWLADEIRFSMQLSLNFCLFQIAEYLLFKRHINNFRSCIDDRTAFSVYATSFVLI